MTRLFQHVNGFGDNTKYVRLHKHGTVDLVMKNGEVRPCNNIDSNEIFRFVGEGQWIEIIDGEDKRYYKNNIKNKLYSNINVAKGSITSSCSMPKDGKEVTITEYKLVPVRIHKFTVVNRKLVKKELY